MNGECVSTIHGNYRALGSYARVGTHTCASLFVSDSTFSDRFRALRLIHVT